MCKVMRRVMRTVKRKVMRLVMRKVMRKVMGTVMCKVAPLRDRQPTAARTGPSWRTAARAAVAAKVSAYYYPRHGWKQPAGADS